MLLIKIENEYGQLTGALTAGEGEFSTGSKGYKATGKITYNGKRYQTQINMVEIGSKPETARGTETGEDADTAEG